MAYDGCRVIMVVAMSRNRVIGRDGAMPWRIPADVRHFKTVTMGKPVVMGRKTFESIGKALPGRPNIVITRQADWSAPGVAVVPTVEAGLAAAAGAAAGGEIAVIGGGEIYAAALPWTDDIHLTCIEAEIDGDTLFPPLDPGVWRRVEETPFPDDPKASHPAVLTRWTRTA